MRLPDTIYDKGVNSSYEKSFRQVYELCYHPMLSIAYKYVGSEAASDIVQDTFLRLWNTSEGYIDIGDLHHYLYRAVRNRCLNYIRDRKVEDRYRSHGTDIAAEDYFYHAVLEEDIFVKMRQAIECLPDIYRDVLALSLEGLSDKEVSEKLDITVDNVKTRKKRGKSILRDTLKNPHLLLLLLNVL